MKVIGEPNVSERREQEVSNPVLASTRFNSLTGSGGRTAPLAGSGGGSSGYSGGGGGGGGDDEARRYVAQVIARLNSARIGADQSFLQSLNNFASAGIARMQNKGGDSERFQQQWDEVISAIVEYSRENRLRELDDRAFERIRTRLCPGFWPFC